MLTEQQNPNSQDIDRLSTAEILRVMNDEDATVATTVRSALPSIEKAVETISNGIANGGRLIYVGAGTSGRLGILDAVECVPTFSTAPNLVIGLIAGGTTAITRSIERAEDNEGLGRNDVLNLELKENDTVVGIAASGKTPYVIGALNAANEKSANTIGIACNIPSPVLEIAQIAIGLPVGPEIITGSTRLKAGTAQKMVLNMLSTATMVKLGKVYKNLMVDVQVTNDKLADRARRIISQVANIDYEEASQLLEKSNNNVKAAIVMSIKHVTLGEATQLLKQRNGLLHEVIG